MRVLLLLAVLITYTSEAQELIGVLPKVKPNSRKLMKNGARICKTEQGKIEFDLEGGNSILYFDRFGIREVEMAAGAIETQEGIAEYREQFVRDGDYTVRINLFDSSAYFGWQADWELTVDARIEQEMGELGLTKTGSGEHLGKVCVIWSDVKGKNEHWVWRGIVLKKPGKTATSLDLAYKMEKKHFDILKTIKLKSQPSY